MFSSGMCLQGKFIILRSDLSSPRYSPVQSCVQSLRGFAGRFILIIVIIKNNNPRMFQTVERKTNNLMRKSCLISWTWLEIIRVWFMLLVLKFLQHLLTTSSSSIMLWCVAEQMVLPHNSSSWSLRCQQPNVVMTTYIIHIPSQLFT